MSAAPRKRRWYGPPSQVSQGGSAVSPVPSDNAAADNSPTTRYDDIATADEGFCMVSLLPEQDGDEEDLLYRRAQARPCNWSHELDRSALPTLLAGHRH